VSRVELWRLISETAAQGATIVMATTYLDEAERASSVYLLSSGRTLAAGQPDELIRGFPGEVTRTSQPTNRTLAWRSGRTFRQWWPSGAPTGETAIAPTLEDVAIVAELQDELASSAGTS